AATLECSEHTLHTYGITFAVQEAKDKQLSRKRHEEEKELRKIFDNLITSHDGSKLLLMRSIYDSLGRQRDYIVKKYPGLINYITISVKEVNEKTKRYQLQQLMNRISVAAQLLSDRGGHLSIAA